MRLNILDKPCDEIVEKYVPYCAPLVVGIGIGLWFWFGNEPLPSKTDKLVESSINIFSILVGFIGAALAIVFAIDNKPVITKLKEEGKYQLFIRYFFHACAAAFLTLGASFVLNGCTIDCKSTTWKALITIWLTVVMVASLLSLRVTWLLFRVLNKNCQNEQNQ